MHHLEHEMSYRGKDIVSKLKDYTIVVCGCGAIGSNLIVNMIRQGFENITVVDNDRIEDHNRGMQIWGKREVGSKKVQVMKNIAFASMGIKINVIDQRLTESNIKKINWPELENLIVIDSFDNSESRGIVTDFCKERKIDCLHIGLAEGYGEVVWNERYIVPKGNNGPDVCEYPLSRNICMMSAIVGIETIIQYVESGNKVSRSITLGDFKILELE